MADCLRAESARALCGAIIINYKDNSVSRKRKNGEIPPPPLKMNVWFRIGPRPASLRLGDSDAAQWNRRCARTPLTANGKQTLFNFTTSSHQLSYLLPVIEFIYKRETCWIDFRVNLQGFYWNHKGQEQTRAVFSLTTGTLVLAHPHSLIAGYSAAFAHTPWLLQDFITAADSAKAVLTNPWNSADRTGRADANTMQHPLTGGTCVALPNVDMCPQLSCALTFMYLQQVSEWARARADVPLRTRGIQCEYAKSGLWQAVLTSIP